MTVGFRHHGDSRPLVFCLLDPSNENLIQEYLPCKTVHHVLVLVSGQEVAVYLTFLAKVMAETYYSLISLLIG